MSASGSAASCTTARWCSSRTGPNTTTLCDPPVHCSGPLACTSKSGASTRATERAHHALSFQETRAVKRILTVLAVVVVLAGVIYTVRARGADERDENAARELFVPVIVTPSVQPGTGQVLLF